MAAAIERGRLKSLADSALGSSSKSPSKPSAPKSGPLIGGSSPSKPKSPVKPPPKAPKLPTLPKPKSGWKPPKGSLPGYTPGHPPYHGSGGHLPVSGGGQSHEHDRTSSVRSCIHPKGFERLRCEKADAVIGTIFAIIGLMLLPLLIYLCIRYCKERWSTRKTTHEEDGMELTRGTTHCDPSPQISREVVDSAVSNIGLATSTSEETFALAKEQTPDRRFNSSRGRKPSSPGHQPRTGSMSRGRKPFRYAHSMRSVTSSLSSGMIRTAMVGQALQDPIVIDVPPSLASSRKNSERMCSVSDVDRSSDCSPRGNGGEFSPKEEGRDCVDNNVEGDNRNKEAESCSRSSGRRSSSHDPSDQPENHLASPGDRASEHSVSRPSPPTCCNQEDDLYFSPSSEISEMDTQDRL